MKKLVLLAFAMMMMLSATGCIYSASTWNTKNGKMYVLKNDGLLWGLMRGVYECSPAGASFNCKKMTGHP